MTIEKKCKYCWKIFQTRKQKDWKRERIFCSQKCYRWWRKKYYKPSEETKRKTSETMKWRKSAWKPFQKWHTINNWREPWNKWMVMKNYYDDEQYEKFINTCRENGLKLCMKVCWRWKRTSIELKIEEFLKETWERFFSEYPMLWITVADFYLPDKRIIIYADWDYWHNYPNWTERDHYIRKELKNENYIVLSFWERDINKNFEIVKQKIKEML